MNEASDNDGPRVGASAHIDITVGDADTAIAQGSGDVPVLATPRVVALVEGAACLAIAGTIDDERTTVGTHIEMQHLKPSPIGSDVRAMATLAEVDGRLLHFEIEAYMGDDVVAVGKHSRVIVRRAGFGG